MRTWIIAALMYMPVIPAAVLAQEADSRHACGGIVHVFSNPITMPDPALGSLPAVLQREVKETLRPLLAKEAKITNADQDGSKIDEIEASLRVHHLGRDAKGREVYAAWWNIPTICGHGNCPIWLLEVDAGRVNNLAKSSEPNNPGAIADDWLENCLTSC